MLGLDGTLCPGDGMLGARDGGVFLYGVAVGPLPVRTCDLWI